MKFALRLRFVVYAGVMIYVACEFFFCGGPLWRRLMGGDASVASADGNPGLVARVGGFTIDRSQLDRAVTERLWLEGGTLAGLSPAKRKSVRYAALDDLIDHELLRMKVAEKPQTWTVSEQEIADRVARFTARFPSKDDLEAAMKAQGIPDEKALRDRLTARLQQEKFVEAHLAPLAVATDDEARQWFAENQQRLALPERIEARHIFLPTLDRDAAEVKQTLTTALADLTSQRRDFATLARELSDDPTTKDRGGSLGWLTRSRLPAELADPLFALPLHQPALLQSKLGWHLVEITARKPAEPRSFDQAKPEILAALEAVKRRQATAEFRAKLRQLEANQIVIYRERVEDEGVKRE